MSPEHAVTAFRPAALPARTLDVAGTERTEAARAAGFAAGWAAGAHAAADAAAQQRARLAEEHAQAEAGRDAALTEALATLQRAGAALAATAAPVISDAVDGLHAAALALAEAVLGHELTPGPTSARSLLTRALDVPAELGLHTVRLNPTDLTHVRDLIDETPSLVPAGVRLVADPSLAVGDVVSEHAAGYLDGQIRTALDRARRALEGEL